MTFFKYEKIESLAAKQFRAVIVENREGVPGGVWQDWQLVLRAGCSGLPRVLRPAACTVMETQLWQMDAVEGPGHRSCGDGLWLLQLLTGGGVNIRFYSVSAELPFVTL